ncbi:MAG: 1,4-dihydroxy-2-naphthoate octaprenyltransferase, partial [Bacteroidota bacterium]
MNRWVEAARPRTLPLAVASILLGNLIALTEGHFSFSIAALAIFTTLFLQILSNFANDLGDTLNGIDTKNRTVAQRTVQTGKISIPEMKNAVKLFGILSFISGIYLIYIGLKDSTIQDFVVFLLLGLLAILAAITYTIGKKPYGYLGLGDFSVFLFFGLVGTCGSYYLQTKVFEWSILLPASSSGLLSVAVLNLNNLRDIENDRMNGKFSVPVRIGKEKGFIYQKSLYLLAILSSFIYLIFQEK